MNHSNFFKFILKQDIFLIYTKIQVFNLIFQIDEFVDFFNFVRNLIDDDFIGLIFIDADDHVFLVFGQTKLGDDSIKL
jgi:hypothetical protein